MENEEKRTSSLTDLHLPEEIDVHIDNLNGVSDWIVSIANNKTNSEAMDCLYCLVVIKNCLKDLRNNIEDGTAIFKIE